MNHVIQSFAWCMVQVTFFTLVAAVAYALARRWQAGGFVAMLAVSLATVGVLTLFVLSPYPRWGFYSVTPMAVAETEITPPTRAVASSLQQNETQVSLPTAASHTSDAIDPIDSVPELPLAITNDSAATAPAAKSIRVRPLLILFAWIASLFGLFRLLAGAYQMRRVRVASAPLVDSAVTTVAKALQDQLGIRQTVDVRECSQLSIPATFGWWRPLIFLPPSWRSWTSEQLRAVLAHELAHIRDRHFATWMLAQLALVAHYYHPLVHWLTRRLRLEQEIAADALAAATFADRRQYTSVLASLALSSVQPARLGTPLGLYMSRPLLMRRIAMLRESNDRPLRTSAQWKFVALLAGICLVAVAAAGCRPTSKSSEHEFASADERLTGGIPAPTDPRQTHRAVILFKAQRQPENPILAQPAMSDAAWKTFCNTQIAAIKSTWVLQAAFRDPAIAKLPLVKALRQPIGWLRERLQIGFDSGSELLYIAMYCTPGEAVQAKQLVDAVARAYEDEYLFKDKNQKLVIIDTLKRNLTGLSEEIRRDSQKYLDLATELGSSVTDGGIAMQVSMKQLDRIEAELLRVQNATFEASFAANEANSEEDKRKLDRYAQQTKFFMNEREKLRLNLEKASEQSVELSELKSKIEQSQQLANEISRKLQALEFDAKAPAQIRRLYSEAMTDEVAIR